MMSRILLFCCLGLICRTALASGSGMPFRLQAGFVLKDSAGSKGTIHSPKKASIYSAVLPGLGQAYNRKYWKIPLVYAALGTSAYFIAYNRKEMRLRQDALTAMLDGDSNSNPSAEFARIPVNVLKAQRNNYRTNRDYSIIAFAGFYLINIIDAAVDAHFYNFNIDRPLSARREKKWNLISGRVGTSPAIGLSWRF